MAEPFAQPIDKLQANIPVAADSTPGQGVRLGDNGRIQTAGIDITSGAQNSGLKDIKWIRQQDGTTMAQIRAFQNSDENYFQLSSSDGDDTHTSRVELVASGLLASRASLDVQASSLGGGFDGSVYVGTTDQAGNGYGALILNSAGESGFPKKFTGINYNQFPTSGMVLGDLAWINVPSTSYRWLFVYDNVADATYPWTYIGGTPIRSFVDGPVTNGADSTWQNIVGSGYTIPRTGYYHVHFGSTILAHNSASGYVTVGDESVPVTFADAAQGFTDSANSTAFGVAGTHNGLSSAQTMASGISLQLVCFSTDRTNVEFHHNWFEITPIRMA